VGVPMESGVPVVALLLLALLLDIYEMINNNLEHKREEVAQLSLHNICEG